MKLKPLIQLTADGSHTLFVPELDEHYHSTNGAMQESEHVFIKSGLQSLAKNDDITIFEIGFGTGLNAFLTLLDVQATGKNANYISVEAYPLPMDIVQQLNYPHLFSAEDRTLYFAMHEAEWGRTCNLATHFSITKLHTDFTQFDFSQIVNTIDLIYFDAFAPDKQSEMWTQHLFDELYKSCRADAILVTYCAKGIVRRMLQQAGFVTERLPGPPGKREMLRATKQIR